MSRWFRSEEMEYVSLIINEDAAHKCVQDLGKLSVVQFTDLNPEVTPFQRRFVSQIKRCDEIERKLRYFDEEIKKLGISVRSAGDMDQFIHEDNASAEGMTPSYLLEKLESDLEAHENNLRDLNSYCERLTTEFNERREYQEVLIKAKDFFSQVPDVQRAGMTGSLSEDAPEKKDQPLLVGETGVTAGGSDMRFSYITGVIRFDDSARFERMLFRSTRGNCYVKFAEIEDDIIDPKTGEKIKKLVFIVFFKSKSIEGKINKICDAFDAHRYGVPDIGNTASINAAASDNYNNLQDSRVVLLKNRDARWQLCSILAENVERWTWVVQREKATYFTLNLFKADVPGILRGEGWILSSALEDVKEGVKRAHAESDMQMPSLVDRVPKPWPTPPTHFHTNKVTKAFQDFVNTYGVPRYREANPALFTLMSFPFLFGVMYGDLGHGFIIFLFGLLLVLSENKPLGGEMGVMIQGGRYMLLFMGIFAMYNGFIYNDFFAIGMNLFGSKWVPWEFEAEAGTEAENLYPYGSDESVYPFGVDPIWHVSGNELLFFNSMKMKLSVIVGITQMSFGIILKGINCWYFKDMVGLFLEFIPMMIFNLSIFGYMVFLIFCKWSINWQERMAEMGPGEEVPNLITVLINMFLSYGSLDYEMYPGQKTVQMILPAVAILMVPILLLGRPLTMLCCKKKEEDNHQESYASDVHLIEGQSAEPGEVHSNPEPAHGHEEGGHGEHESFGEVFIHQCIETIEFVLGMISNTASYLRLWALSLAHTELSLVFWEKAMLSMILTKNPFFVFGGYAVFAACTTGVILLMDTLECFLHALRLQWVEFQNKFYKADGYLFEPFSYKAVLTAEN